MAFPTNGILSTFTGTDEDPLSEGGNWNGPTETGQNRPKRVSNAISVTTAPGTAWWTPATFGPDTEVYLDTIPTIPTAGKGIAVQARIVNPGNASTAALYLLVWTNGTGFRYFKMTAGGTFVQIGTTYSGHTLANGEGIGLTVTGTGTVTLTGYYKSSGVWTAIPTGTDASSPLNAAGFIGVQVEDNLMSADGFGGGTISAGGGGTTPPPVGGAFLNWFRRKRRGRR